MEELTKHQIVLVTLLVSFVTSIATGIVTVALMEQAPAGVTQTISRVVEKTVEKVIETGTPAAVTAVNTEVRVVKEEDLVISAVERSSQSLVRIKGTYTQDPAVYIGLGIIVSKDGLIVADKNGVVEGGIYLATLSTGKTVGLDLIARNEESQLVFFKIVKDQKDLTQFPVAQLGNSDQVKIGQTVIALGGDERDIIAKGILTGVVKNTSGRTTFIEADPSIIQPVSPLITLSGDIVGLKAFRGYNENGSTLFHPINSVKEQLEAIASTTALKAQ